MSPQFAPYPCEGNKFPARLVPRRGKISDLIYVPVMAALAKRCVHNWIMKVRLFLGTPICQLLNWMVEAAETSPYKSACPQND